MLQYRKELDGLRALAVVVVIIYHANLLVGGVQLFPGGFFGVDIFFVLSGYLITSIIRNSLATDTFSFADFYWRRAKRIVPALLLVLASTSLVAYKVLLPSDLVEYAQSLKHALYFGSNHFFYSEDSYVAAASIYKPLLHTWSLAVEWQFYVVFPILVWLNSRQSIISLFNCLLVLSVGSFVYAQWMVSVNPDYAFYLLPTRAWELLLGGLVTFIDRDRVKKRISSKWIDVILAVSIGILIGSVSLFDHHIAHPSYLTLLPVLSTCFFITLCDEDSLLGKVFCLKPMVFIGTISYSLYLWHQPVFVFFRFLKHDYMRPEQFLGLLVVAIILAWLSVKFVERPFRAANKTYLKLPVLGGTLSVLFALSFIAIQTEGFPHRNGPVIAKLFHNINALQTFRMDNKKCHDRSLEDACSVAGKGDEHYVLVGDSHAGAIGKSLYDMAKRQKASFLSLSAGTCLGIDTIALNIKTKDVVEVSQDCLNKSKQIARYLEASETPRSTVFFVGRLPLYLSGEYFDNQRGGKETGNELWVESLNELSVNQAITEKLSLWSSLGHKLVVIYPIPEAGWIVPIKIKSELDKFNTNEGKLEGLKVLDFSTSLDLYKQRTRDSFAVLDDVEGVNVVRIYPEKVLCKQEQCLTHSDSELYYYDDDHLSAIGAELLIQHVEKVMTESKS